MAERTDFDNGAASYAYDAAGRLTGRLTGPDRQIEFEYNELGQVTRKNSAGLVTTYEYDLSGHLGRVTSQDAQLTRRRDRAGRVLSETVHDRTITYGYDELGRRASRITPTGALSKVGR
nr:hypothetical protein OH820_15865 [Streptomyces sp. NBC_00857]